VDLTHLAHDRYQWRAVVNTVMNLRLQDKRVKPGNLPTASGTVFTFYKQSVEGHRSYNSCNSIYSISSANTFPVTLCHFILCEPQEFPQTSPAQKVCLSSQVQIHPHSVIYTTTSVCFMRAERSQVFMS